MLKIKAKKQRNKGNFKTEPDMLMQTDIRVSLADPAKQKLMEISCINNHLTQSKSKEWNIEEEYRAINMRSFHRRYNDTLSQKEQEQKAPRYKLKVEVKMREVDRLRKLYKTQQSMRGEEDETSRKNVNSVNFQFEQSIKQRQMRIHSNGQVNIEFDNTTFSISEKILKEAAFQTQNQFYKTHHLFHNNYSKRMKERNEALRAPIFPYRKATFKNKEKLLTDISLDKVKEMSNLNNDLCKKKEFLDLSGFLIEEKRNIFIPTKACLTTKNRTVNNYI